MNKLDMSKERKDFELFMERQGISPSQGGPFWLAWQARAQLDSGEWVSVPKGWKLVPEEPTPEMIEAPFSSKCSEPTRAHYGRKRNRAIYQAMLNAVPQPPEETK